MPKDDPAPAALVGRLGVAFAYVCFVVAIVTLSASVYLLPLDLEAKIFLAAGGFLLVSMIAVLAVATHLVSRPAASAGKSGRKATSSAPSTDADSSQTPR